MGNSSSVSWIRLLVECVQGPLVRMFHVLTSAHKAKETHMNTYICMYVLSHSNESVEWFTRVLCGVVFWFLLVECFMCNWLSWGQITIHVLKPNLFYFLSERIPHNLKNYDLNTRIKVLIYIAVLIFFLICFNFGLYCAKKSNYV